jgi:hypothetical protein
MRVVVLSIVLRNGKNVNDQFWVDEQAHKMSILDKPALNELDNTPYLRE